MSKEFTYLTQISDENGEKYYVKTVINEEYNTILMHLTNLKTSWVGTLDENKVRQLARKFPTETNDSFYSHTQRAFSKGNNKEGAYIFTCKKLDKNRIELVWKEKVETLNILKIVGSIELDERPNNEILTKIMDYSINEIETLQTITEQKTSDIKRLNTQLTKALQTIERTVNLKDQLEADLYKKFVLVLNSKKVELSKLKKQLEQSSLENDNQILSIDTDYLSSNKRGRDENTSEEDEVESQREPKMFHHRQDSSLDLGNDEIDYKTSTIPKHHQKRQLTTNTNSISTRPFVRHTSNASAMPVPSLPDDSQTADEILDKI